MPTKPVARLQFSRRVILGNVASLLSSSVLSQGMTALALLLTARQLGAAGYGQYAGSFVLTSFAAIVFSLGMDIWLLREGSRDLDRLGELLGSVLAIKGIVGIIWLGGLGLLAPLFDPASFPANLVRLSAFAVWLDSLFATVITAYKASLRNEMTLILEAGSDGVWLLATLALMGSGVRQADVYMRARVAVLLVSFVLSVLLAWHWLARKDGLRMRATVQTAKHVLGQAFPFAASELLAWTSMRIDVLIVALTLGERAVGLYSPSVGIVNALFLVPATVYTVIVPVLSNLFVSDARRAWRMAGRGLLLLLAIGMGMSLVLVVGARPLASLLGASFSGSEEILQILGIILVFHSLTYGMAAILVATSQQRQRVVAQAVAVSVNALLNLLVVRWLGIRGVAIVYVITEIVLLSGYAALVWRYRRRARASVLAAEGALVKSDGGE